MTREPQRREANTISLNRTISRSRTVFAVAAAPFVALFNNFRRNYTVLITHLRTPWMVAPILVLILLPLFLIDWHGKYEVLKGHSENPEYEHLSPKKKALLQTLRISIGLLYSFITTSALFFSLSVFFRTVGTAARLVPVFSGLGAVLFSIASGLYGHDKFKNWHWKEVKQDFVNFWTQNLRATLDNPQTPRTRHLGRNLGGILGHIFALTAAVLGGMAIAAAFPFLGVPGAVIAGIVGGAVLLLDFHSFVVPFYRNLTKDAYWLWNDFQEALGLRKTPFLEKVAPLSEKARQGSDFSRTKKEREAAQETRWNNARPLRYSMYVLLLALVIWCTVATALTIAGPLGVISACAAAVISWAALSSGLKSIAQHMFLSNPPVAGCIASEDYKKDKQSPPVSPTYDKQFLKRDHMSKDPLVFTNVPREKFSSLRRSHSEPSLRPLKLETDSGVSTLKAQRQ